MVDMVCSNFDNVIVIYNGANQFELGFVDEYPQIKSVVWCPGTGNVGFNALGKVFSGEVNPSGKTPDTFIYDMTTAPWWNNAEKTEYTNLADMAVEGMNAGTAQVYAPAFTNYVEGIYVGYKYYETAAQEGSIDYDKTVQYPFGYGLSYTEFEQKMGELEEKDGQISVDVEVTNTGDVAGKDVVEVYYKPPYTNGGIEKSSANLIEFSKTDLLQPGETQTVTVTFSIEDMASYDENNAKAYVLEKGDYVISINSDSHTVLDQKTYTAGDDVVYKGENKRASDDIAASNVFENAKGDVTYLSRADHFANYEEDTKAPASAELGEPYISEYHLNSNFDKTTSGDASAEHHWRASSGSRQGSQGTGRSDSETVGRKRTTAQSIYKFRGATIENILNFEKVFTGAKTIRLEQNYRSTANILNAANSVIKNNMGRKGKTLWTDHGDGEKVHHYTATNEQDEASHIADVIGEHLREGASLKDHAVLYRMNAQSNPIETYFARAGIPYRIVGGQRFFDRKEVKDINSYLAVIVNPRDDVRLRRIINEPARKIGMTTIEKIGELAASKGVPMMEIIAHVRDYPELQRAAAALERFYEMYRDLCDLSVSEPLDQFVGDVIAKSGYEAMLKAMKEEGETRRENLGQLVSSIKTYADQNGEDATLSGFLEEVALISDLDSYDNDADSVTMMTIHSAKGLEFPYVFVVGMEDGIFPGEMAKYNEEDMEEERRLCYVAITRAKKELYLSTSRTRMIFGQTRRNPPSAFLSEIDPGLLDETQSPELTGYGGGFGAGYGSYSTNVPGGRSGYSGASRGYLNSEYNARPRGGFGGGYSSGFASGGHESPNSYGGRHQVQSTGFGSGYGRSRSAGNTAPAGAGTSTLAGAPSAAPQKKAAAASYAAGDIVEHRVFGRGKVLKATPIAGDCIVEIQFDRVGVKKTMANYAPLKKVEE